MKKLNGWKAEGGHDWYARVSDAGDNFVSCNRCGAHKAEGLDFKLHKAFAEKPVGAFPTKPKTGAGNMFKELD